MKKEYQIVKWRHGWSVEGISGYGVPVEALEKLSIVAGTGALIDNNIAFSLTANGHPNTCFVAGTKEGLELWKKEIDSLLQNFDKEEAWLRGADTGLSSLSIFSVLASKPHLREDALSKCNGEIPRDSGDFGRCKRLLEIFPEWVDRLPEVADYWKKTKWEQLVPLWSELMKKDEKEVSKILWRF